MKRNVGRPVVSWGVNDTPTREAIWEFVRENKTLLLELLLSELSGNRVNLGAKN